MRRHAVTFGKVLSRIGTPRNAQMPLSALPAKAKRSAAMQPPHGKQTTSVTTQFAIPDADQPRPFRATLRRNARAIGARRRARHRGRRLVALAAAVAVPAFAAPVPWSGFASEAAPAQAHAAMGFETAGESFPGSAFYYLADEAYSPLAQATLNDGAQVPDTLDAKAHWDSDIATPNRATPTLAYVGPAARPLMAASTGVDRLRAVDCLTQAIYYEAASESDAGQRAVAQVVLNRVSHPTYPDTVCGVVYQGSTRRTGCQFTFTCDGALARKPSRFGWDRARGVALAALSGAVYAPVGLATHYHTLAVNPYWASSLDKVSTIGAHVFYRWKGAAGRPAAFTDSYSGGEPGVAGRTRSVTETATIADAAISALPHAPAAQAFEPASSYTAPAQPADRLPASGTVRSEYARSGEWIVKH